MESNTNKETSSSTNEDDNAQHEDNDIYDAQINMKDIKSNTTTLVPIPSSPQIETKFNFCYNDISWKKTVPISIGKMNSNLHEEMWEPKVSLRTHHV